jgi:hypothetical protein
MNLTNLLQHNDQQAAWEYIKLRTAEYLLSGYTGRLVLNFHNGRVQLLNDQANIAGVSQLDYYSTLTRQRLVTMGVTL